MDNSDQTYINRLQAPMRYESLYWKVVEVIDLSGFVEENPSVSSPDIDIISTSKLFKNDEVILWIGKPNVFLLIPDWKGNHVRFAAKSCWRWESKLERTRWVVQSGIFFILQGLTNNQIIDIRESAKMHEWERNITCVNANTKVLNDAWIKLWNNENLDDIYLPISVFRSIEKYGLKINDIILDIEKVKTTSRYLENQALQINKAVWLTIFRHAIRFISGLKKNKVNKKSKSINEEREIAQNNIVNRWKTSLSDLSLKVSNPSKIVVPLRIMWWAHTIFTLNQNRVDIDKYLPSTLKAFPQENPSLITKIKKIILFNKYIVSGINKLLQNWTSSFQGKSEFAIHNMFETQNNEKQNKYNIVASKSWLTIAKIDIKNKIADWILSKHVLISNYNDSVRFAWEVWKDKNGIIWVNNNSWTYMPNKEQLSKFIDYLKQIFPNVDIRANYEC